ncbi:hypothetical protein BB559_001037 [Furculomyces boomerangus]|nr:hypothetical protein BB559_001037 [Furculomyces boomerangus]
MGGMPMGGVPMGGMPMGGMPMPMPMSGSPAPGVNPNRPPYFQSGMANNTVGNRTSMMYGQRPFSMTSSDGGNNMYQTNMGGGTNFVNGESAFVANLSAYMNQNNSVISGSSNYPLLSPQQNFQQSQMQYMGQNSQGGGTSGGPGQVWESGASDKDVNDAVFAVLSSGDLMSISKRDVRNMVGSNLRMSETEMKARKNTINDAIMAFINQQQQQ